MDLIPLNLSKYKTPLKKEIVSMINNSARLIKEGQFNKAISLCNDALNLDPKDSAVLMQKGVAHSRLNQIDEALEYFDLAIKYDPEFAGAYYNKATIKALQNDVSGAISLLEEAIKLDSRYARVARNDEDFMYLRNNPSFTSLVG